MRSFWKLLIASLFFVLLIFSCSMLKDVDRQKRLDKSSSSSSSSTRFNSNLEGQKATSSYTFLRDSASQQYQVVLWPKGQFSFSKDSGFKGEAHKVWITGKASSVKDATASSNTAEQIKSRQQKELDIESRLTTTISDVHRSSKVSWRWVLAGSLAVATMLMGFYRKIKRKN